MTSALSSRTKPSAGLAVAVLAIVGSAALTTPAFADAKQSDVVAACKRTKGCGYIDTGNGTGYGCSPHACFQCGDGKCHQTRMSGDALGKAFSPRRTATNEALVHRGTATPVNVAAPSNTHARMGGRH